MEILIKYSFFRKRKRWLQVHAQLANANKESTKEPLPLEKQ